MNLAGYYYLAFVASHTSAFRNSIQQNGDKLSKEKAVLQKQLFPTLF
jgi:hypothetical protein